MPRKLKLLSEACFEKEDDSVRPEKKVQAKIRQLRKEKPTKLAEI